MKAQRKTIIIYGFLYILDINGFVVLDWHYSIKNVINNQCMEILLFLVSSDCYEEASFSNLGIFKKF